MVPLRTLPVLFATALALACATGSEGGAGGGGRRPPTDAGSTPDAARDTGVDAGTRDAGPRCVDDAHPDECTSASALGAIEVGQEPVTVEGVLPQLDDEDWFAVTFPATNEINLLGGGAPEITLDPGGDGTIVMEIRRSCPAALPCGDGIARELLEWSFTDDQSLEGETQYSTRDVEWPTEVYVKVYRRGGPVGCTSYRLTIAR